MKKALRIIGKGIGIIFACLFGFMAACVIAILLWSGVQMGKGSVTEAMPQTPADFVPTVRFVVYTDTHNENERVADMLETAIALYENDEVYKGVDAFFSLGDFSSIGTEPDYDRYIETVNKYATEDMPIITLLGNHEAKNKDAIALFEQKFGYSPDGVYTINGFTFICLSSYPHITEWTYPVKSLTWASKQLKAAESDNGTKAIFVMQHPHNFGTVYGSSVWSSPQTNSVWAGHNRVVCFSGHSHFPMNDPKSINQTTYTNVGVGAMARFELDNNYIVGQHPYGYDTAAQFAVVEANDEGSVRITEYDLNSDTFFHEYFIENVNDESTYAYTYKNQKAHDTTPVFARDTEITAFEDEKEDWVLTVTKPETYYIVHDYQLEITDKSGNSVVKKNFINDYYVVDEDAYDEIHLGKGVLNAGQTYTVKITAVSAYHKKSVAFVTEFTAQ